MTFRAENSSLETPSTASPVFERAGHEGGIDREVSSRGSFSVLGVAIDAIQIPDVILRMRQWIAWREGCRYIAVTGMHGITEARHKAEFWEALTDAELVVADGMPLVWIGRLRGHHMPRRVYGPELMLRFCEDLLGKWSRSVDLRRSEGRHALKLLDGDEDLNPALELHLFRLLQGRRRG